MDAGVIEQLVTAAQAGGGWAFERLYQHFAPAVAGYLRVQGARDPEDLTSEVFIGAFTRIGGFQGDARSFRSWLFTIAHHRLVDDRRRRSRTVATEPLEPDSSDNLGGDAEREALALLGNSRVTALLAELSPDQRDVVALRVLGDLSIEETARIVGKRQGAVKALQRRALTTLRRRIERQAVSP